MTTPLYLPDEDVPEPCAAEIRPATFVDQPEFCDEDAVEGSEFCEYHREALS